MNWKKTGHRLKNRYILTLLLFLIWLLFFDQNNIIDRIKNQHKKNQLAKDITYYRKKIAEDSERLKELKTDNKNLEKFAREQFFMKKENEDIFVIVEEDE